jgi:hypothetical protein
MALFSADPNIGREIYICTPHRGSGLADLSLTAVFIKLVKLPTAITSALIDLPGNVIERGRLTSVAGLSPSNELFDALAEIPIQVPYHSIIGDRGKGDAPKSRDGVVPYWSSHLEGAKSEIIVPDNHGAFDDPEAIEEIRVFFFSMLASRNNWNRVSLGKIGSVLESGTFPAKMDPVP